MIALALTYAVAGLGVAVFMALSLPLPWLLGPLTACLVAALAGAPLRGFTFLNNTMRTILGVAVGATITPVVLASMLGMWPTLLLMPVMIAIIGLIGVPYFQRLWGFDFATSYYSAMPGGLQDMLAFGEEAGAAFFAADLSQPPGVPAATLPPSQLAIMMVCALLGWQIAARVGLFGASILGPLILSAIAALGGLLQYRPPVEAVWAAQFFIGVTVGVKYAGITGHEIRRDLTAGLGFCVILIVLTVIIVEAVVLSGLAPPIEAWLAFAPGGQAEMTILALIIGADMAFVIAHHLLRIVVVILGAPLFARMFRD